MGVARVAVPSRGSRSLERKEVQKQRWFRAGQRWRTGCEGRISVLKRRHGLSRCRYRGFPGMQRWVGLGVIADNIIQIGDRKSTRLNSSHRCISYAVFCLKKKKKKNISLLL